MSNIHHGTPTTMALFVRNFIVEAIINSGLGTLYGSLAIMGAAALYPPSLGYVIFALVTLIVTVSSEEVVEPTSREDIINDINQLTPREMRQYSIIVTFSTAAGISLISFVAGTLATITAMYTGTPYLAIIIAVGYPVLDRILSDLKPHFSLIAIGFRMAVEGYRVLQGSRHAPNYHLPEEISDIEIDGIDEGHDVRFDKIGDQARSSGPLF